MCEIDQEKWKTLYSQVQVCSPQKAQGQVLKM